MHQRLVFFLSVIAACFITDSLAATNRIHCYLGTWAYYRPEAGKFDVDNIDPFLCDTIIYAFVGMQDDGTVHVLDSWLDVELKAMARFTGLKAQNPNLKALLAVGGWNEGARKYSAAAADPTRRQIFVKTALELVQTYGFDGLDVDWEYPNQGGERGGAPEDVENFITWLKEIRAAFEPLGLLLTAAVGATKTRVDTSYDVPALNEVLDYIHLMSYDLHGSFDVPKVIGHNAPLYASSVDVTDLQKELNIDNAVKYWIEKGADPQKIILGLATYGRGYTLEDPANTTIGAPFTGPAPAGPYTREAGVLGYNEICESLQSGGWVETWDDEQQVPHAVQGTTWVGYDNTKSLGVKAEYAKNLNVGGVMIWSIETDDFVGVCGLQYPLLNTLRSAIPAAT